MFCSPSGYPFEKFDELEKPGDEPKKESCGWGVGGGGKIMEEMERRGLA